MRALFGREFQEDLLAFRILEPFPVALEEPVRTALATDPDHQRLPIVHALSELIGPGREQSIRCPFEEEERRPRLELRILLQQLLVAGLERTEMLFFLFCQLFEDAAAPWVTRQARGATVELQPAALGGYCNPQRIASEEQLRSAALDSCRPARAAGLARTVDLQTLCRGVKLRAAATSSSNASISELRNSKERLQVLQMR